MRRDEQVTCLIQDAKPHLPFKLGKQPQATSHLKSEASTVKIACRCDHDKANFLQ